MADAASVIPSLDAAIEELRAGSRTWSALTLSQRIRLLRSIRATVATEAEDWALTAARAKGLDLDSPLVGEEWLTGPYATVVAIDAYIETLTSEDTWIMMSSDGLFANDQRGGGGGFENQEIADFLGLTIETVSRVLSDLKRRGIIAIERNDRIRLVDVCRVCKMTGIH